MCRPYLFSQRSLANERTLLIFSQMSLPKVVEFEQIAFILDRRIFEWSVPCPGQYSWQLRCVQGKSSGGRGRSPNFWLIEMVIASSYCPTFMLVLRSCRYIYISRQWSLEVFAKRIIRKLFGYIPVIRQILAVFRCSFDKLRTTSFEWPSGVIMTLETLRNTVENLRFIRKQDFFFR